MSIPPVQLQQHGRFASPGGSGDREPVLMWLLAGLSLHVAVGPVITSLAFNFVGRCPTPRAPKYKT